MTTTTTTNRKTVLFVDDDAEFLGLLQPYMERLSGGEWEVVVAANSAAALSVIDSRSVDLAVLDVNMPVMDGMQLLQLVHRKHPQLRKAVLSGLVDATCRAEASSAGAEMVLEKPRDAAGYGALFAALNALIHLQSDQGFRGVLRRIGLEDLIQMECLSRHSLVLEVVTRGQRGRIYIRSGALVHAEFGDATGEPALQQLLTLTGGEFHHQPYAEPARVTLEGSWEFLLMEAVRQRDEAAGAAAAEEPAVVPPSSAPSETASAGVPPAITGPMVDELVVCSAQGEVLYALNSPDAPNRCALCATLMEASARLQTLLPVGALERVEFVAVSGRMIARLQDNHGIFLRASEG